MNTNSDPAFFYSITQKAKRCAGILCCVFALTCIISCSSSHHTSGHYHSVHTYQGANDSYAHRYNHGNTADALIFEAIIIGAILIIPPVIEAIGEVVDEILVGIGLKQREQRI